MRILKGRIINGPVIISWVKITIAAIIVTTMAIITTKIIIPTIDGYRNGSSVTTIVMGRK